MPRPSLGRQCFHCSTAVGPWTNLGRHVSRGGNRSHARKLHRACRPRTSPVLVRWSKEREQSNVIRMGGKAMPARPYDHQLQAGLNIISFGREHREPVCPDWALSRPLTGLPQGPTSSQEQPWGERLKLVTL